MDFLLKSILFCTMAHQVLRPGYFIPLIAGKRLTHKLVLSNKSPITRYYRYPQSVYPKSTQAPIQIPIPTPKSSQHPDSVWLSPKSDIFADRQEYTFSDWTETADIHLLICINTQFKARLHSSHLSQYLTGLADTR